MVATRRRGVELERAIYAAVVAEVAERGYSGVTYEGVAMRAGTSKPVLYRRWPTRAEMMFAALVARADSIREEFPDTGDLVGDLLAMLAVIRKQFGALPHETTLGLLTELEGDTAARLQSLLLRMGRAAMGPLIERARARGELGESDIPDHVLSLPLDLARHDLLIRSTMTDSRIDVIVRVISVPLLELHSRTATRIGR
nr:TetR/AcrR family transcriptional regulator [Rhodococcus sp. (in: high G+C Gram-positive bacteria)]